MEDPNILLIQETKSAVQTTEDSLKRCWHNCDSYQTESKGASGGLAILWKPATVILDQVFSSSNTITAHSRAIGLNKEGMITNAYGPKNS